MSGESVRVLWWQSARAILRLTWARTVSPVLIASSVGLVLLPMLFALVFVSRGAIAGDPVAFLTDRFSELVSGFAVPILSLLLGTSAFSAEADDGTLMYVVTTTTPRWWIVLVRMLFASIGTAALSVFAVWGAGTITTGSADPQRVRYAFMIAVAFGAAVYSCAFTVLALITRRSLVVGLGYVLFWEGVLTSNLPGLNYLSIRQWMVAVAAHFTETAATTATTVKSGPTATFSLAAAAVVVVMSLLIAAQRLARPRLSRIGT